MQRHLYEAATKLSSMVRSLSQPAQAKIKFVFLNPNDLQDIYLTHLDTDGDRVGAALHILY